LRGRLLLEGLGAGWRALAEVGGLACWVRKRPLFGIIEGAGAVLRGSLTI
jgi:hypothetical protein